MEYYVLVDIGCIECGESSSVIGIFEDLEKAKIIQKKCEKYQDDHWTGQHYFEIYTIKEFNVIVDEYYKKHIKE